MKLEVTMKEMQELMNKKGQVEIMGKCYTLNPQDELLIKFIMDFKERHETDYYDILSNAFNDVLIRESMQYNYGVAGGINLVPLQPGFYPPQGGARVEPMPQRPYQQSYGYQPNMSYSQAPQMSYNDMKNMYKKQFAQQLGLDIDGDEKHQDPTYNGCDCHVCDGNCEVNLPDENKNGIDKDDYKTIKSFLDKDGNLGEDKWCNDCVAMGIECDDNCDKHHEDFEKIKCFKQLLKDNSGDTEIADRIQATYEKSVKNGSLNEEDIKEIKEMGYKIGYKDAKEDKVEYNPFAKAMMGDKVDLDDPKLKTMPKVEVYQAKHPISNKKKLQLKKTDEPKGMPVVTPEMVFKPKEKTDNETQNILSSKVMESDEDK